jgi:hypothetical protein
MSLEPDNKIYVDNNKLLPVKNKLEKINDEFDNQFKQKIKMDCETLANAFDDVINNKLPLHKLESNNDIIKGNEFDLNIISNLKQFNKLCGYNVDSIQLDLSKAIGYKTCITLEDYSFPYPPINTYKLHVIVSPLKIK